MARSNKPLIWLPFAAGGTLAAIIMPAIMLVLLLATLDILPERVLAFERLQEFLAPLAVRLMLLLALGLPLWHAAHRLRMTLQDLGVRNPVMRRAVAWLCYGSAMLAMLVLMYLLMTVS